MPINMTKQDDERYNKNLKDNKYIQAKRKVDDLQEKIKSLTEKQPSAKDANERYSIGQKISALQKELDAASKTLNERREAAFRDDASQEQKDAQNKAAREAGWKQLEQQWKKDPEAGKESAGSAGAIKTLAKQTTSSGSTPQSKATTQAVVQNPSLNIGEKLSKMKQFLTHLWTNAPQLQKNEKYKAWYDGLMASDDLVAVAKGYNAFAKQLTDNKNYRRRMKSDVDAELERIKDYSGVYDYDEDIDFKISKITYRKAMQGDKKAEEDVAKAAAAGDKTAQSVVSQLGLTEEEMSKYGIDDNDIDDIDFFKSLSKLERKDYFEELQAEKGYEREWDKRQAALREFDPYNVMSKHGYYYNSNIYKGKVDDKEYGLVYDYDNNKWVKYDDLTTDGYKKALDKARESYKYFGRFGPDRKLELGKGKGGYRKRAREHVQSRRKKEE